MPPPAEGFATRLVLGPALRTQPDRRLVALVRNGYEVAFEEIVRRYGKPLGRYAAAIVGARGEDVIQDSFSKALVALRRDGAEIELRPWLYRIVRNTALNDLRDRPPSAEELAEAIAGGESPVEELERREDLTDLMQRLRSLPEPQRTAIVMRELEGLSHEEIAAALGLSGGAARQTIYRARRALRDGLGMLLPLPLLKLLLAGGTAGGAEVAAGAVGAGGASVGAGAALKAATATVLVAGAVGTGVAIQENRQGGDRPHARAETGETLPSTPTPVSAAASADRSPSVGTDEDRSGSGSGGGGEGSDNSGPGNADDGERSGSSHGDDDDDGHSGSSSGPGRISDVEEFDDSSGPGSGSSPSSSGSSGPSSSGSGSTGSGDDDLDSSGSGSGNESDAEIGIEES